MDKVKATLRRYFLGGPLQFADVATVAVPERRLRKAADPEDVKEFRVRELAEILPRALRADPHAALDLVSDLLGLREAGLVLAQAPRADAPGAALHELAEAGAAVGAVQAAGLEALADGVLDPEEAEALERHARHAEREIAQVTVLARAAQAPQLHLGGVR